MSEHGEFDPVLKCIEPFGIDDGELDEMPSKAAFVLGFEFARCIAEMDGYSREFVLMIHEENLGRVRGAIKTRGFVDVCVMAAAPGWYQVSAVKPAGWYERRAEAIQKILDGDDQ